METKKNTALALLVGVQYQLKAPKNQTGNGIRYHYRTAEQVLQAAKELCKESGLVINCTDDLVMVGNHFYVKAVASVIDVATGDMVSATGWAREAEQLASMSAGQLTGCTSSFARKYALCGLFAVDGSEDYDDLAASGKDGIDHIQQDKPKYSNAPASTQGTTRDAWLDKIRKQAEQKVIPSAVLNGIIKARYGKSSSNYLKTAEAQDFAEHFDDIVIWYETQQAK